MRESDLTPFSSNHVNLFNFCHFRNHAFCYALEVCLEKSRTCNATRRLKITCQNSFNEDKFDQTTTPGNVCQVNPNRFIIRGSNEKHAISSKNENYLLISRVTIIRCTWCIVKKKYILSLRVGRQVTNNTYLILNDPP